MLSSSSPPPHHHHLPPLFLPPPPPTLSSHEPIWAAGTALWTLQNGCKTVSKTFFRFCFLSVEFTEETMAVCCQTEAWKNKNTFRGLAGLLEWQFKALVWLQTFRKISHTIVWWYTGLVWTVTSMTYIEESWTDTLICIFCTNIGFTC